MNDDFTTWLDGTRTPYPSFDFQTTYRYLLRLKNILPIKQSFTRGELVEALGFNSENGRSRSAISALVHYGMFIQYDGLYWPKSNVAKFFESEDAGNLQQWQAVALDAMNTPPLYKYLYGKYKEATPDAAVNEIAEKLHVKIAKAAEILTDYDRGLSFIRSKSASLTMTKPFQTKLNAVMFGEPLKKAPKPSKSNEIVEIDFEDGFKLSIPKKTILKLYMDELGRKGWL